MCGKHCFLLLLLLSVAVCVIRLHEREEQSGVYRSKAAICLYSVRFRMLNITGESIAKYLVRPLNADVFVAGDLDKDEQAYLYQIGGSYLLRLDKYHILIEKQMSADELAAVIPESAQPQTQKLAGDSLTYFDVFDPSTLLGFYWRQKCFELVEAEERRRGSKYEFVVFARPDMEWVYEHPPLDLLSADRVWVPNLQSFSPGGVQTSTLTCPRELCPHFAYKWELAQNGTVRSVLVDYCTRNVPCGVLCGNGIGSKTKCDRIVNAELSSAVLFRNQGVRVGYYISVSALVCSRTSCDPNDPNLNEHCRNPVGVSAHCGRGQHWKNPFDSHRAKLHKSKLISLGGWTRGRDQAFPKNTWAKYDALHP